MGYEGFDCTTHLKKFDCTLNYSCTKNQIGKDKERDTTKKKKEKKSSIGRKGREGRIYR